MATSNNDLRENQLELDKKRIEKNISLFNFLAWTCILLGLAFLIWGANVFGIVSEKAFKNEIQWEKLGNYSGGIVTSIWSLGGLFFIYVAFLGQKTQMIYQEIQLERQKIEIEGQSAEFDRQRFETTFFNLLGLHNQIVENISAPGSIRGYTVLHKPKGRECLTTHSNVFRTVLEGVKKEGVITDDLLLVQHSYSAYFKTEEHELGHYFRNIYHIAKFIQQSNVKEKKLYTGILLAQLSSPELYLLFYNGLSEYGGKLKTLIEELGLLNNLNKELIFEQSHLNLYKDAAYL
ncbi:hypothetical protein HNQ91_002969 [Filimonas zeae]|uniref:Phage abortive infection protein n=1 Tax=Filimonas zeae TaxID=1737353 RepID=A0A917IY52_9BACT|nr:putative phage abortive infection protein [Filimonas zeae]MDR6339904.1 hypothetical protein [Filimonas zeae]GGH70233.1 hypothetical protein GCM10011379_28290 [Filimonas zeae]